MFSIFTPKEWLYASICFVVGLVILYNYSSHNSISIYIMIPVSLVGMIFFYMLMTNERVEVERPTLGKDAQ